MELSLPLAGGVRSPPVPPRAARPRTSPPAQGILTTLLGRDRQECSRSALLVRAEALAPPALPEGWQTPLVGEGSDDAPSSARSSLLFYQAYSEFSTQPSVIQRVLDEKRERIFLSKLSIPPLSLSLPAFRVLCSKVLFTPNTTGSLLRYCRSVLV